MSRLRLLPAAMAAALIGGLFSGLSLSTADAASQSATLSMPRAINENVRFGVAGFVTPIKVGRPVDLQVKSGKRWKKVVTVKQDQFGGLNFYGKVGRTSAAKASKGYEIRKFRVRARASGSLREKVSAAVNVKVLLDPKIYYRVLKASLQSTADGRRVTPGCTVVSEFSATKRSSGALGKAETGRPKWKAKRLANGSTTAELAPKLSTRWSQDLKGCRFLPEPAACTTTTHGEPTGGGREPLWVAVNAPRSGSKGTVKFAIPTASVGYVQAADSVCNVPWLLGGAVPVKIQTKSVSRSTLLDKKAFTVVNQGNAGWVKDIISGQPADLKLRYTASITLQRVDASGRRLR